jgi:hypothetical protein
VARLAGDVMKKLIIVLGLATLFTSYAMAESTILRSLPSDVQKEI